MVSGTAPSPLNGVSEQYDITIIASMSGYIAGEQKITIIVYAILVFVLVPSIGDVNE
jgi:hypothetical protein